MKFLLALCINLGSQTRKSRALSNAYSLNNRHAFSILDAEVDVGIRGDSAAARIEGLTLEGEFDNDSDGTQTGALPRLDFGGIDSPKQLEGRKGPIKLAHRSFK